MFCYIQGEASFLVQFVSSLIKEMTPATSDLKLARLKEELIDVLESNPFGKSHSDCERVLVKIFLNFVSPATNLTLSCATVYALSGGWIQELITKGERVHKSMKHVS